MRRMRVMFRSAVLCLVLAMLCLAAPPAQAAPAPCAGDCNGDAEVLINELIIGVNIALGNVPLSACTAFDHDGTGIVMVAELVRAVNAALDGCDAVPTVTATATGTAAATVTHTPLPTVTETAEPTSPPTPTATPIATPSGLSAVIVGEIVQLSWTPPGPGNLSVRVLRRLNEPVDGPEDPEAIVIFFGDATGTEDAVTDLLPDVPGTPRTYHYAVYACTAGGLCETTGSATTLTPTLVQVLRAGGYTIHWRHSAATICNDQTCLGTAANPAVPDWWKSCSAECGMSSGECETGPATARQLDATGVTEATTVGAAFDTLGIPVGRVVSSEFCRNVGTAELMDFGPPIETHPGITFFVYDDVDDGKDRCDHTYELLAEPPAEGTNTAIIGHAGFAGNCPNISSLAWSEAAIFKPDGMGGQTFITRVPWHDWDEHLPPVPTALTAEIVGDVVELSWTPPDPRAGFTGARVLRRLNEPVAGPDDPEATLVYSGPDSAATHPLEELLPDTPNPQRTYHYAVYGCAGDVCESTGAHDTVQRSLLAMLQAGGFTILWRHANADVCVDKATLPDPPPLPPDWWKSCVADPPTCTQATARQLSDTGIARAMAVGAAIADLEIPFGRVIASEYCRTRTTAELFDLGPTIELDPGITYFVYDEENRCQHTFDHVTTSPAQGTNTAIVGHAGFSPPCSLLEGVFGALGMSEAAVFRPDGQGGAELIARIPWDQWANVH